MQLIAHRGFWRELTEQNSLQSLRKAFELGLAVETDLRLYRDKLVLSHDPVREGENPPSFEDFLETWENFPECSVFLNIKECGLLSKLSTFNQKLETLPGVFFDLSTPELISFSRTYPKKNLSTRLSDYETSAFLLDKCEWVWVDCFEKEVPSKLIEDIPTDHKIVFVSPELHGRSPFDFWRRLETWNHNSFFLCTDYIEQWLDKGKWQR